MSSEVLRRIASLEKKIIQSRPPCHVQVFFNPSPEELEAADRELQNCPRCSSKPGHYARAPSRIIFQVVARPSEATVTPKRFEDVEADGISFHFANAL
jgi:hypothetical protein